MNQQGILTILFIIIVAVTGYFWFQPIDNQATRVTNQSVQDLEDRLTELRHLKDIRFDTSVLKDKFFESLSLPIIPPPPDIKIGRANPFIPF